MPDARMGDGGGERFLVFAGMRNEGAFLLEWVCWYRMLGFRILVGVNDCTDASPALLERLKEEGWLDWFAHAPPPGTPPKTSAHRAMRAHPAVAEADWLLICDVDEFLVFHVGDGTVGGFLDTIGRDHIGVAFHWKCFGTGGLRHYQDGLVHRMFQRCGSGAHSTNVFVKTLMRHPLRFARHGDHAPEGFDGVWGEGRNIIVDAEGRIIDQFLVPPHRVRFTDVTAITHRNAQMNHYVLRSDESFDLKRGTPSASALRDRYTEHYYRMRNRNGQRDLSALAWADRFDAIHAAAMALPGVRRLHHRCCADYVARLCAHQGLPPEADPRWRHHMAEAARPD